jgi:serine/threonine-protein kinase RsbW
VIATLRAKGRTTVGSIFRRGTDPSTDHEILRIEVEPVPASVEVLASAVAGAVVGAGFTPGEAARARIVIDELCRDAIERTEGSPDPDPVITLVGWRIPGGLALDLRDRGMPVAVDRGALRRAKQLATLGFVDHLSFEPVTAMGPVAHIRLRLPAERLHTDADPELGELSAQDQVDVEQLDLRIMVPDDAAAFARLVYRCYGYTYLDCAYDPAEVAAEIESGSWLGAVAVTPHGEVVAHSAFRSVSPDGRVVEAGTLMVDPRYRHHGLERRLNALLMPVLLDSPVIGVISEPVMIHTATQHVAHETSRDVGVLLNAIAPLAMAGFADRDCQQRVSLLCTFCPVGAMPDRTLYPPSVVATHVQSVVSAAQLPRTVAQADPLERPRPTTVLTVRDDRHNQRIVIEVAAPGADLLERVAEQLDDAISGGAQVVHLDLAANDPELAWHGAGLEQLGFVFGALLPECGESGDLLRLQRLIGLGVERQDLNIESEATAALVDSVVDDLQAWHDEQVAERRTRFDAWRQPSQVSPSP